MIEGKRFDFINGKKVDLSKAIDAADKLLNACECSLNVIRYLDNGDGTAQSQIEKIKSAITHYKNSFEENK